MLIKIYIKLLMQYFLLLFLLNIQKYKYINVQSVKQIKSINLSLLSWKM